MGVTAKDPEDAQGLLPTAVHAGTTTPTHIPPAATTESAKEKTDTLEVTEDGVKENGTAIEALEDAVTETTVHRAETGVIEIFSTIAEEEEVVVVADGIVEIAPLPLRPEEAPVLPRSPRSPLQT